MKGHSQVLTELKRTFCRRPDKKSAGKTEFNTSWMEQEHEPQRLHGRGEDLQQGHGVSGREEPGRVPGRGRGVGSLMSTFPSAQNVQFISYGNQAHRIVG